MTNANLNLIENIETIGDKITIKVSNDLKPKYIKDDFWVRVVDANLNNIPLEITIIPFILNIAPVVWLSNQTFQIDKIDSNLYISLKYLKQALFEMYPNVNWSGNIIAKNKINCDYFVQKKTSTLLFSGGLDSIATSYNHLDDEQTLVTVMGSDVRIEDKDGWEKVKLNTNNYAKTIDAKYYFVESNFMVFINNQEISSLAKVPSWWAYVQHGMGLSAFLAIPAYLSSAPVGYIASTHSTNFNEPWGSSPKIENYIKWANFHIEHDCYELTRQGKVELVVNRSEKVHPKPYLRVCYSSFGGENCGKCEKCCRTMNGLVVSGTDFKDYGFELSDIELILNTKKGLKSQKFHFDTNTLFHWQDIQSNIKDLSFYKNRGYSHDLLNHVSWLKIYDFKSYKEKQERKRFLIQKLKSSIQVVPGLFPLLKKTINVIEGKKS